MAIQHTIIIRPSADRDLQHSRNTGSTGYSLINEVSQDGDSTYIYCDYGKTKESKFQLDGSGIGTNWTLTGVSITAYARKTDNDDSCTMTLTSSDGTAQTYTLTTSYAAYTLACPNGAVTLDGAGNATTTLKIKTVENDDDDGKDGTVRVTQCYMTLTFSEPTSKDIYFKESGAWQKHLCYQKVNGTWVVLTSTPSGWTVGDTTTRIDYPFEFNKAFKNSVTTGPVETENWMVSDYIAVTPNVSIQVQGQGSNHSNTLFFAYKSDKSYYDYWGGSGEQITTVDGTIVYKRTMTAANMANTYYVRVNAKVLAMEYIKVWQNGILLFDGSKYRRN